MSRSILPVDDMPLRQAASAPQRDTPSEAPPQRRGRVLVIDDDDGIGRAVLRTLTRDHDVVSLDNASEALNLLEAGEQFDVILCDLMMPVVTGDQFYRLVAGRFPSQLDKIVFMTGGAFTVAARTLLEQVPNDRLEKPFDLHALRVLVSERVR